MADHVRTSAEIEREIEEERGALAQSLEALQESLLPENLISTATDALRDNGADILRTTTKTARENPVAVAVVGAGLTMLLAGIGAKKAYDNRSNAAPRAAYADPAKGTSPGLRETSEGDFDQRVAAADAEIRRRDYASRSAADEQKGLWQRTRGGIGSALGHVNAGAMRKALSEGTENMSKSARERVMRARASAISAQERLEAKTKKGGDDLMNLMKDEPLIAGALVFAAGAALGALLPRSSVENAYVGEHRDRLLSRADEIFREETAKLKAVAEAAVEEGRTVVEERVQAVYDAADAAIDGAAEEAEDVLGRAKNSYKAAKDKVEGTIAEAKEKVPTGRDAVNAAEAEVKEAASRVTQAAKDEAEKQNLGGSV